MNQRYPDGWDEARVRAVIAHYETQTDDEAIAEDEAAYEHPGSTMLEVPTDLVVEIEEFIEQRTKAKAAGE